MNAKTRHILSSFFANLLIMILIVFVAGPFVWMAVASLQGENALLKRPPEMIPRNPTFDNYRYVFTGVIPTAYEVKGQLRSRISQEARLIGPALKNSFVVASVVLLINLLLGTPAAYTFARIKFRGKKVSYSFILASRLMPAMAIAIPYYVIILTLKLLDTYLSLILIYASLTLPFTIWFLTLYISNIPSEMEDAGLVDGCTRFQAMRYILLPMMAPGLVAAAAFAFMTSYNEFLFARFLTQSIKTQTGPVIIASISGNPDASYSLISVCITLGIIPPLILAVTMRKWLTEGLSASITYH
jgi:multiple sugar transport system permease protein